jgi:hypothetical protein
MTSAEFAGKYRVLKSLTEHGARSQIAQEIALGRMVMVHHLDVGSANDRQRLLASVNALDAATRPKVLEIVDVDGVKVVVTQFLATFTDLPSWLQEHSSPADAPTVIMHAVPQPPVAAPPRATPARGSVQAPPPPPPPAAPPPPIASSPLPPSVNPFTKSEPAPRAAAFAPTPQ